MIRDCYGHLAAEFKSYNKKQAKSLISFQLSSEVFGEEEDKTFCHGPCDVAANVGSQDMC